jgi:pantoate--beta-alanine ligase
MDAGCGLGHNPRPFEEASPMPVSPLSVVRTVPDLRAQVRAWRAAGLTVGMVPTMGALHDGHLSLVRLAKSRADRVLASVFVNPTQFGPNEDFDAYPRDEAPGASTTVTVAGVSEPLDGQARPGHFAGVATIVTKLLNQAQPDVAVFGEKDYQQLQVIKRLVRDLDLPVEVIGAPTARAEDGLALSSRNAYLTAAERALAPTLGRALRTAAEALKGGARVDEVEAQALAAITAAGFSPVDYFEVRGASDLARLGPGPVAGEARILVAARLGKTRLIDNMAV